MGLYDRIVGIPFIYDHVRPLIVGGVDMTPVYALLKASTHDTVLDIGCGTGDALRYLTGFARYRGFDGDERAIAAARRRATGGSDVSFEARLITEDDVRAIAPTRAILAGLLHHLPDEEAADVLRLLRVSAALGRVVTQDPVVIDGEHLGNMLTRLDRGRYCRDAGGYRDLAVLAGMRVVEDRVIRSNPDHGLANFFVMVLEPAPACAGDHLVRCANGAGGEVRQNR
jgi:SAM-dependent methyltransferase